MRQLRFISLICSFADAVNSKISFASPKTCADPEGTGGPDPLENYSNIGFLSNTGTDPLKITKLPIQHSMLGHHRPASETPFKWHLAGGPFIARLLWYLDPSSPQQARKKNVVRVGSL